MLGLGEDRCPVIPMHRPPWDVFKELCKEDQSHARALHGSSSPLQAVQHSLLFFYCSELMRRGEDQLGTSGEHPRVLQHPQALPGCPSLPSPWLPWSWALQPGIAAHGGLAVGEPNCWVEGRGAGVSPAPVPALSQWLPGGQHQALSHKDI